MNFAINNTSSTTGQTIVFDHINGIAYLAGNEPEPEPEPAGPLSRLQYWLWCRETNLARILGNAISDVRYWLWLACR